MDGKVLVALSYFSLSLIIYYIYFFNVFCLKSKSHGLAVFDKTFILSRAMHEQKTKFEMLLSNLSSTLAP